MDSSTFFTKAFEVLRNHWLPILLFLIGFLIVGYGLIVMFRLPSDSSEIVFEASDSVSSASATFMIDVAGAVVSPGVYELDSNARVQNAIEKAGGLSESADGDWVAKNLNLAAKLQDGSKLYIPARGEDLTSIKSIKSTTGITGGSNGFVMGGSTSSLISINTSSQVELESLPGIGPVTAQKIISNRPYVDINELVSKKAVGSSIFEKIKDLITI